MPYIPKLKLVHVAIPKTGSTSVIRALKQLADEHDAELTLLKVSVDRRFRKRFGLGVLDDQRPGRATKISSHHGGAI